MKIYDDNVTIKYISMVSANCDELCPAIFLFPGTNLVTSKEALV